MIASAAAWDFMGALGVLPPWWPPVSYVLAGAGVAAACLAILIGLFTSRTRTGERSRPEERVQPAEDRVEPQPQAVSVPDDPRAGTEGGWRTPGQLLAIGIVLAAWVLRGDAEIPPDPPLVVASVLGAVLYTAFTIRRR